MEIKADGLEGEIGEWDFFTVKLVVIAIGANERCPLPFIIQVQVPDAKLFTCEFGQAGMTAYDLINEPIGIGLFSDIVRLEGNDFDRLFDDLADWEVVLKYSSISFYDAE